VVEPGSGRVSDRGQAIPVLLVVLAVAAACAVGVARVGARAVDGAQAQTAADAAALAGVIHGRRGAEALAARNGARVVSWRPAAGAVDGVPSTVSVTVVLVGDPSVSATARATVEP
jgi:hypothetical protein